MVQVNESVGTAQKGSINAVSGSGMASMSEASMDFQPRMEEPSKPSPSEKLSSFNSEMGQLKCCQVPKVSTNFISTILAPCLAAMSITLLGVLMFDYVFSFVVCIVLLAPAWRRLFGFGFQAAVTERGLFLGLFGFSARLVRVKSFVYPPRQTANLPFSSVRMRTASSMSETNTFPSPIFPVLA